MDWSAEPAHSESLGGTAPWSPQSGGIKLTHLIEIGARAGPGRGPARAVGADHLLPINVKRYSGQVQLHFVKDKMGQKEGVWRKQDFSQLTLPLPAEKLEKLL